MNETDFRVSTGNRVKRSLVGIASTLSSEKDLLGTPGGRQ
jgi:hypothetical protein